MSETDHRPVYLVELFSLDSGALDVADVSGELALALQSVYWHLLTYDAKVEVRVSDDRHGQLEGITFLREDESFLATVSVYHLDRERDDAADHVRALHQAARTQGAAKLQSLLSRLF